MYFRLGTWKSSWTQQPWPWWWSWLVVDYGRFEYSVSQLVIQQQKALEIFEKGNFFAISSDRLTHLNCLMVTGHTHKLLKKKIFTFSLINNQRLLISSIFVVFVFIFLKFQYIFLSLKSSKKFWKKSLTFSSQKFEYQNRQYFKIFI